MDNNQNKPTVAGTMDSYLKLELSEEQEFKPEDLPLKKRLFYGAMIRTFGNITQSCMIAGIKRATYRNWLKFDEDFRKLMQEGDYEDRLLDFAESKLAQKIEAGDIIAILFTLKTKGKRRGYIEGNNVPVAPNENTLPTWFDNPKLSGPTANSKNAEDAEVVSSKTNENDEPDSGTALDAQTT